MTRAVCCRYAADNPLLRRCYSPFSRCYCSLLLEEKGNKFMLLEGMGTSKGGERHQPAAGDRRAVRSIGVKRWVGWLQIRCKCSQQADRR